ncbi:uncharacterized protein N7496_005048 [Penicillium cataractarum]|uniref:Nephrocystin 3-like N-terminal domain-containing protein n=1 Tax=Penicillium cataractarum TaxID=2100454 RepID=A0A9W9SHA3_9EURO|nr:uncharacterized protein N7496_005048 [Penicillium cataractarum]KAJ5377639.1 hypothetical protein N7496_005048 [Penicillium cataractarum]
MASLISLSPRRRQVLRDRILFALRYETIDEREVRIPKAYESTFEWAFRDTTSEGKTGYNLKRWLESDDQVYWITGKAGSGKSTLMKYICQPTVSSANSNSASYPRHHNAKQRSPGCKPYLDKWAGGKKLVIASFYFWNFGSRLQRTRAGLFRSLLYGILSLAPELIPDTFLLDGNLCPCWTSILGLGRMQSFNWLSL